MILEQKVLSEKIEKLGAFISENPIFGTLAEEEQNDMHMQLRAMSMYNAVLMNRIKRATAE